MSSQGTRGNVAAAIPMAVPILALLATFWRVYAFKADSLTTDLYSIGIDHLGLASKNFRSGQIAKEKAAKYRQ